MSGYNSYSGGSSEKQPIVMGFTPAAAPYDEPPPSYNPQDGPQQSGPSRASSFPSGSGPRSNISSPGHSMYAPPPGPPPSFAPSPNRVADYSPYPGQPNPGYGPPPTTNSAIPTQHFPALLTPPPPSFQRAPSRSMPYGPFEPLEVHAAGRDLEDGFVATLPTSVTQPHPFGTHDVKETDWLRFLDDIRRAGAQAARDRPAAASPPLQIGRRGGLLSGLLAQGIQGMQGSGKSGPQNLAPIIEVLQYWNQYFFNQRSIEVDLTGPTDNQDDYSNSNASSSDFGLGLSGRRRGRRSGGGPLSSGLRELKTELMNKAAGSGGGQAGSSSHQRWCIIVRYKGLSAW